MDDELEQTNSEAKLADPVYELVRATVRELARRDELDIPCVCDDCLEGLTDELYGRVTPYKRALTI